MARACIVQGLVRWLHAGRGETVIQVQQFEDNAKKVTDFCRANLKVTVMEAFEKVLKPGR